MSVLIAFCISLYQKFLSPLKGFRCAHGVVHGHSCSEIIKAEVLSEGALQFVPIMKKQFAACREAYDHIQKKREQRKGQICDALDCSDGVDCSDMHSPCDQGEGCSPTLECYGSDCGNGCGDGCGCDGCGDIGCCDIG